MLPTPTGTVTPMPTTEIPLMIKAKNVFLIAAFLKNGISQQTFPLLYKVKQCVTAETPLEDSVPISVTVAQILMVMETLAAQNEGTFAATNKAIKDSLMLQIQAMLIELDETDEVRVGVEYLVSAMTNSSAWKATMVQSMIESGRQFVLEN